MRHNRNSGHGKELKGISAAAKHKLTPGACGRFGRIFDAVPETEQPSKAALEALAGTIPKDGPSEDNSIFEEDGQENRSLLNGKLRLPSGYTYFGQFIDHDLTFDPTSSIEQVVNEIGELKNFRTPRFDLDNVYGGGPGDQPYLYDEDGLKLRLGSNGDLQRIGGRAVIGDPRNDENRIVSQLQHVFVRFHNAVIDQLLRNATDHTPKFYGGLFGRAQQIVRWTYQWMVVNDFLPRICKAGVVDKLLALDAKTLREKMGLGLNKYHETFIPIEFAGAAYRFGHSMVRPSYHLNDVQAKLTDRRGAGAGPHGDNRVAIFAMTEPNLNGFRPLHSENEMVSLKIDWKYFFDFSEAPGDGPKARKKGNSNPADAVDTVQPSYRIDTFLVDPLSLLNIPKVVGDQPFSLAARNLLRSHVYQLPMGQTVAAKYAEQFKGLIDIKVLTTPDDLKLKLPLEKGQEEKDSRQGKLGNHLEELTKKTPLWFYLLAEAHNEKDGAVDGASLGSVGSILVAGTFLYLLRGDSESYLAKQPGWTPRDAKDAFTRKSEGEQIEIPMKTMADLITFAQPETVGSRDDVVI